MRNAIRTFERNGNEWDRLNMLAALLTAHSPNGWEYFVGETYFDYGQDWKWTTVLCFTGKDTYQALNPREQAACINGVGVEGFIHLVDEIFEDRYNPDKKEA